MKENPEFNWVWNVPDLRRIKQPDTIDPKEFESLIHRIDNERVDPLLARRNQAMLWMTYGSCFRAVEVCQWRIDEALHPNGELVQMTRLRAEATKGDKPALAPIVIDEQRRFVNEWLDMRVKHGIGLGNDPDKYRGLNPKSHVFMSNHHGRWGNFKLVRKISKGKEYYVATAVSNLITKLYKDYGHSGCSSHTGRHSMARLVQKMYRRKGEPSERLVQNLLHHTNINSQVDYTDIDWQHIKDVHEQMLPKPKRRGRKTISKDAK